MNFLLSIRGFFCFQNRSIHYCRDSNLKRISSESGNQDSNSYNHNSIKEDLLHSIFDDLWAEVYLKFEDVVTRVSTGILLNLTILIAFKDFPASKLIQKSTSAVPSSVGDDEESEEEYEYDLLSAITIRPIPLQKRDQSAKSRVLFEQSQSPEPFVYERPTSAKPTLGFSGRRPVSAKPHEVYGASIRGPAKFSARQTHRGHAMGLRLVPLSSNIQAPNSHTLNESMYVTSMAKPNSHWEPRPSTSYNLGKKLPPLRGIISSLEQSSVELPSNSKVHHSEK